MMRQQRTDLAAEARELWRESAGETTALPGVAARDYRREGFSVTRVEILDEAGAEALGKPAGTYVTVDLGPYFENRAGRFAPAVRALAGELAPLLPEEGAVFIAGLGNAAMTPDAIGPAAVGHLLITRHLGKAVPGLRPVAGAAAGVLGTTGMEAAEWVRGMAERVAPAAVVVIDALAARGAERLCRTVQIADTGIIPGSGVGNARQALNRETLGVPVVSVGVPTVVDALTLAADLLPGGAEAVPEGLARRGRSLFVTPRDVDEQIRELGRVVGYAVNLALQRGLTVADLEALLA